jgi:hypothetical protein
VNINGMQKPNRHDDPYFTRQPDLNEEMDIARNTGGDSRFFSLVERI